MNQSNKSAFLFCGGLALILNLYMELLGREGLASFFAHVVKFPLFFILNWLLIWSSLCLILIFKRRCFALVVLCVLWLALGGLNAYVLSYRIAPLAAIDFFIIQFSWEFIGIYVNIWQMVLLACGVALVVFLLLLLYRKAPKSVAQRKKGLVYLLLTAGVTGLLWWSVGLFGIAEGHLSDMKLAGEQYGFVYCFFRGSVERGIPQPQDYSKNAVNQQVDALANPEASTTSSQQPNVIVLQLESFFDINRLNNVVFSANPLPVYTYLKEKYSGGKLAVPTMGAGTANTEFEILTGMNLDFFGSGEYPYKTILKTETCEAAPYNFMEQGYSTFAIHSNNATFYDRNEVFPNLGFQTFISSEYMTKAEETTNGWIKDACVLPEIMGCLNATKGKDYVYAITVQGHGAYPNQVDKGAPIQVLKSLFDEEAAGQFEYYVNQLRETDQFLLSLIEALNALEEPVVLALFGDHLPAFDFEADQLEGGDLFETEYLLWANYPLEKQQKDMQAYQLSAYIMERAGMDAGVLTKLHQKKWQDADYLEQLKTLQYDMLYGEKASLEGMPYNPTNMRMGLNSIVLRDLRLEENGIRLFGENFTKCSVANVNGGRIFTQLAQDGSLWVADLQLAHGDKICVQQLSDDGVVLSQTVDLIYQNYARDKQQYGK